MYHTFLIKYGEIGVKGKNRHLFEDALVSQICRALSRVEGKFSVWKEQGRIYVECPDDYDYDETVEALQRVFGIVGICPVIKTERCGIDELARNVVGFLDEVYEEHNQSFKVFARRADKSYPLDSMEICQELGGRILDAYPDMHVDVHDPELKLTVEVRDQIFLYAKVIPGPGGLPLGMSGRAMLLLSGGIDSPVAGYMIGRRGVSLDAVYFHAPPYTSERARQKVIDLAKQIAKYTGPIRLHVVNFTEIQLYIYEQCPHDELTIIMRRYMMLIAEAFADRDGSHVLVTGESIGQVASQTMQSLTVTDEVCTRPVFRPLIGFDKQDIVEAAKKIGTYETSILPYEDCCTIFVAKHPVTKPNLTVIKCSEQRLREKIDQMVQTAIETAETIQIESE